MTFVYLFVSFRRLGIRLSSPCLNRLWNSSVDQIENRKFNHEQLFTEHDIEAIQTTSRSVEVKQYD